MLNNISKDTSADTKCTAMAQGTITEDTGDSDQVEGWGRGSASGGESSGSSS